MIDGRGIKVYTPRRAIGAHQDTFGFSLVNVVSAKGIQVLQSGLGRQCIVIGPYSIDLTFLVFSLERILDIATCLYGIAKYQCFGRPSGAQCFEQFIQFDVETGFGVLHRFGWDGDIDESLMHRGCDAMEARSP
jgi:hypothetical protein